MAEAREKTTFEAELDSRIASAKEKFEQQHTDLFPQEAVEAAEASEQPTLVPASSEETAEGAQAEGAQESHPSQKETPAPTAVKADIKADTEKPAREESVNWKRLRDERRESQREIKKLQAELAAIKAGAAPAQAVPPQDAVPVTVQDDPFGFKAEMDRLRAEINQERQKTQAERDAERITANIREQENAFRAKQPQYDDALNHVVNVERRRYLRTPDADVKAKALLDLSERFADSREDARIVQKAIDDYADRTGVSEIDAAKQIAADLWIAQQRNLIIQNNPDVPGTVWAIATEDMGFQPRAAVPAQPAPAAPEKPAVSPAEQIRATARASAAGKSLSQLQPAGINVPDGPQIRTVQDWLNFHKSNPNAAREYARQMSARDPRWHLNLAAK